jgi:L-ascorbate metabolism protein UlaG (beta-lactamase superfamily)
LGTRRSAPAVPVGALASPPSDLLMADLLEGVTWFRGSSVRIQRGGVDIHVDPWDVREDTAADYVLLTHPHYDNFSEADIERVRGPNTVLIAPASMKKQLDEPDHLMRPGDMLQLHGLDVLAVPAYNRTKKFHPPESEWLGYVFTVGDVTYYHAGDTDFLPSMADIRCDVAFLPCDGHYTMGPEEAAETAEAVSAVRVVPIHWGDTSESGTRRDAERLAELLPGRVRLLDRSD